MNTYNPRPTVNRTFLCKPLAYPISLTICVVNVLTELNGNGIFTAPPATILLAIASPSALPMPNTTPVQIPDFAAGITVLQIVCSFVAPSANDAALILSETALREDVLTLITVGKIIMASTIIAESILDPPVY